MILITDMSCPPRTNIQVCGIDGSSIFFTFMTVNSVYFTPSTPEPQGRKYRLLSNFTVQVDFYIYNVTLEDGGLYTFDLFDLIELDVTSK